MESHDNITGTTIAASKELTKGAQNSVSNGWFGDFCPLLTQNEQKKYDRGPFGATAPSMPQTLFSSYATQSCRALAQALAVQILAVQIQVLVVKLPGEAAVMRIIVHHRRQVDRYDLQRQVVGDAQQEVGGRRQREEEARQRDEEARQRDKEARQRDRDRRPRERRSQERDQNRDRSRTPHARSPSPTPLTNFSVCRKSMREFRSWMTSSLKPTEAKQLRESFSSNFINSSFEWKCPQLDSSMARRFKDPNIKGPELSKAEANEKSLRAEQYKVLDVARPLLFLREKMSEKEEFRGRRENLLKISDPKFVSLLSEPNRFKTRQCGSLFGRTFIKGMVKEARDDQQLRIISRGSAPSSSRGHGNGSSAIGASNGFQRYGSSHGGHYGGSFNNGAYNRGGAARNNSFSNNRSAIENSERVQRLETPGIDVPVDFGPLGARDRLICLDMESTTDRLSKTAAFRSKSSSCSWKVTVRPHQFATRAHGTVGSVGALNGINIPCLLL
ncbi:hypothetical protein OUZ56_005484 [Daphnia magna]|uniref:Uncharacterized protein n=1 Tax=Daphnia magna TaxID=35525 RepID=A0ABQ9YT12_9CRUS|nr:hypothetical protein OUZ56_005484 [Daphnia magna]